MGCRESKKILILRILLILEQYSDREHPITHSKILDYLKSIYNTDCERKAIGRNISFLKEADYPVVSCNRGVFLESKIFEYSELRLLIDSVLASRHINDKHSKQLIDKLSSLGGKYFKKRNKYIKTSDWKKSNNISFFLNVEIIDEAIEKGKQIEFIYNSYDIDKKLHPRKSKPYLINPYQMILHNQRYYLMCNVDKYDDLSYFKIDRITDIKILDKPIKPVHSLPEHTNGINAAKISNEHPYMFTGKLEYITLKLDKAFIGDIIDWFGDDFDIDREDNNIVTIRLSANLSAVRFWALQYGTNIEVLEPDSLRETIRDDIKQMVQKYLI